MTDLPLGIAGVSLQQIAAYKSNYGAHRKGIKNDEVIAYYNTWAEEGFYEDELNPSIYQGPRIAAETLAEHYDLEIRPNVKVIDVAAGSGLLGEQLYRRGFTQLDALDPSDSMLQLATQKRIYHRLLCAKMDGHRTECIDDDYDALIVSGGMGEGHIPVTGLNEMARIVKPGGLVVIVMRNEYLDYVTEYKDKLVPHMLSMQAQGLWEMVDRKIVEKYSFSKDGVVFTFRCL